MDHEQFKKMFDDIFKSVTFKIGLEQQGHIPTVERMREEGKSWDEIGAAIGWAGHAVEEWYGYYLERKQNEKTLACLRRARATIQKLGSYFSHQEDCPYGSNNPDGDFCLCGKAEMRREARATLQDLTTMIGVLSKGAECQNVNPSK